MRALACVILLTSLVAGCAPRRAPSPRARPFPEIQGPSRGGWDELAPVGWRKTALRDGAFTYGLDRRRPYRGDAAARIDGSSRAGDEVGSLSQTIDARPYRGRRVRLVAAMRHDVERWAHAWIAVRDGSRRNLDLDRRPATPNGGSRGWHRVELTLDIPEEAHAIAYGFALMGPGTLWVDEVDLVAVGGDSPGNPIRNAGFER